MDCEKDRNRCFVVFEYYLITKYQIYLIYLDISTQIYFNHLDISYFCSVLVLSS
jgi:hypothetical protein